MLGDVLMPAAEDAGHVMVVVDAWGSCCGGTARRRSNSTPPGWASRSAPTGAKVTSAPTPSAPHWCVSRPVQIYSAEHFVKTHHAWTCAAAPILDPANGDLLGVVDVSGAAATVHPSTLALVDAAARMAESFLREEHHAAMSALRALAGPLLAGSHQPTMVTDADGWVAAASTGVPDRPDRVAGTPGLRSCLAAGLWVLSVGTGARWLVGAGY